MAYPLLYLWNHEATSKEHKEATSENISSGLFEYAELESTSNRYFREALHNNTLLGRDRLSNGKAKVSTITLFKPEEKGDG